VAQAAGVSRALVHTYLGDRRGLIDAVQVQIVGRLDTWVGHGLRRAGSTRARLRAIVQGVLSFVEAEQDAWGVLGASGGFDHPALHGVRARWAAALTSDGDLDDLRAQAAISAILGSAGPWANRGVEAAQAEAALALLLQVSDEPV
jgi:AcrR family transcriptional regulator